MADYDNNLRGVLFVNDKGDNPNRPDMTGSCEIDGVEYKILREDDILAVVES